MLFLFNFVGQRDFEVLLQDVEVSRRNAFAKGSYSNLRTQVRCYFSFCVYFGRNPLPADSNTIYAYVQFLSRSMVPPTVRNYLSGVKLLHIFHNLSFPHSDDYLLQLELRGIARQNPHVPVRAIPVTPSILLAFVRNMTPEDPLHSCVWACSLFLFFTMSRLGSILPGSSTTPMRTILTRDRVNFSTQGILITLLHTKTIQCGRRRLHIPLIKNNTALCPVLAFEQVLALSDPDPSGPAFTFPRNGKRAWLTSSIFISTFRSVLKAGGVAHASEFTGHSFRRGGATWAFQAGIPGELIQICGDWASDAYKLYLEFTMEDKLDLAASLVRHLPR